jgi:DNA transposition AAA+ family ATPase
MAKTAQLFNITEAVQPDYELLRERLRQYLEAIGKSQSEIAKSIGMTPAVLTGFMKGTYKGDISGVAARLEDYLNLENQRMAAPKEPEFAMTKFASQVIAVADYARRNNDIGLVHGDAGVGKTTALEYYAAEHKEVIMITAGEHLATPKAVLEEILDKLGDREYGSVSRMGKNVIQTLRGSGRLIIIDEATELNERAKKLMRTIHDHTKVGIVYAGTHELYKQMYGRNGVVFAQLLSRIGIRRSLKLKEISRKDITLLFEQNGKLEEDCIDFLLKEAKGDGGLRYAKKVYMLASTLACSDGRDLNIQYLKDATEMLKEETETTEQGKRGKIR